MKRFFSILLPLFLMVASASAADTLRVLFVGNSYVQVNNLPGIISQLAANSGDVLLATDVSMGGYTLQNHASNSNTLSQIARKGWDFVILQEQSQLPAFPDAQVASSCYPYARALDSLVHLANPCAKTVFYMTWGRENGDAGNCPSFPLICTYNGMDSLLRSRYTIMAQSNKAVLAPVGVAWHKMRDLYPGTGLYQTDESHPSPAGSYLAACTFYSVLFKKNPASITYDFNLTTTDAANIRQVVKNQVWDSLAKWYQYQTAATAPHAAFTDSLNGRTAQFSNTSQQAVRYRWLFGDSNFDTASAPVHTYAANGSYTVRLIAYNCDGLSDTATRQIIISAASILQAGQETILNLFPNPAKGILNIRCADIPIQLALIDAQGRRCLQLTNLTSKEISLNVQALPAGHYFLLVLSKDGNTETRLIQLMP
ncbi:MAG: PKD domain-containing protein [Bacteroidetes bacterium]|nr:PKD domain-containing protein [Bacteroidota bacterium]MBS1630210.1 PKD domain-containing protein [Bacteroidota bacterium]